VVQKLSQSQTGQPSKNHFLQVAEFAVNAHLSILADQALSQELVTNGPTVRPYLLLAQLECQRNNYKASEEQLREALFLGPQSEEVWAAMGHLFFKQGKFKESRTAYETVLALGTLNAN
jgi:Tfp pilus assembly protein PilF